MRLGDQQQNCVIKIHVGHKKDFVINKNVS